MGPWWGALLVGTEGTVSGSGSPEKAEIGYCKSIDGVNRRKGCLSLAVSTSSSSDEVATLRVHVYR